MKLNFKSILLGLTMITLGVVSCKENDLATPSTPQANTQNEVRLSTEPISYLEEEGFTVSGLPAEMLGYDSLLIGAGEYEVTFSTEFGETMFNVEAAYLDGETVELTTSPNPGGGIGIRIAKRETSCGVCCNGIGFRCGFIQGGPTSNEPLDPFKLGSEDPQVKDAVIAINEELKMQITFTEEVPWDLYIEQGAE